MPRLTLFMLWLLSCVFATNWAHAEPPPLQMIVATADQSDSYHAHMRLFTRSTAQTAWTPSGDFFPVLLGKNGLAWGQGLNSKQPGLQKVEHDGRSPAGLFKIGLIMGYAPSLPQGSKWNLYHQITSQDAWPDDPTLPGYNTLITLKPSQPVPAWFDKHRMRMNDPAYEWLVVIEHNFPNPVPGLGSAIFFHIRRGVDIPSAGCTTMEKVELEHLITWLDPKANPEFVLLGKSDYQRLWKDWGLPQPELAIP